MKDCRNCGERRGCAYFICGYTPTKCRCYWNSETEDTTEEIRTDYFKHFDYHIKNIIGDEEITKEWLMYGYNETNLKKIVLDDELWRNFINCFVSCCNKAEG